MKPLYASRVPGLELVHQGKVRDVYGVDEERLLMVATDRLSAFDVVLPDPIPGKGEVLTQISLFWFERTGHITPNHALPDTVESVLPEGVELADLDRRAMVTRRTKPLPIEAVVRGYLIGSGWKDYQATGEVCGIRLPEGLQQAEALAEPIFTPATKAQIGDHDENIDFDRVVETVGADIAERVRETAMALYDYAVRHASERGIIIADTKFEFGLTSDDDLILIDEAITPDSSRFWPKDEYRPGISPPSFDKQFVRDQLEAMSWNKRPPAPRLPPEIVEQTAERYREALDRLTGDPVG